MVGKQVSSHSKYRNRATGGYASAKEARRAAELKLLEKKGVITNLREQVSFVLIPAQYEDGVRVERACRYVADFVYVNEFTGKKKDGIVVSSGPETVVEDVKSPASRTAEYVIKRKLMLMVHGIKIKET